MAKGMSPVERMAKQQVKPILSSTPTTVDPDDPWGLLGSTPVAPVATAPASGQNFVGPTLDPRIVSKRAEVTAKGDEAIGAGVPAGDVASIVAGKGDPNRGFIGPAKAVGGFLKGVLGTAVPDVIPFTRVDISDSLKPVGKVSGTVGLKVLSFASPAIDKVDFGRRVVMSLLKETGDQVRVWRGNAEQGKEMEGTSDYAKFQGKGGFSWDDFLFQTTKEGGIGGGEMFANVKNPYANQLLGFMADVFLDPTSYITGPGGIAKTAISRGVFKGGARAAVAEADRIAASISKKVAEEALEKAIANGDKVAEKAARKAAKEATQKIKDALKVTSGTTATRTSGRTSNQALADNVLGIRDDAQRFLDGAAKPPPGIGSPISPEQIAQAQRVVEVITPQVIKDIQTSGLAGVAGSYLDIIKGTRTAAQDVLGVRGGLRFGVGDARVTIAGTERLQTLAGKLFGDLRLNFVKTPYGNKILGGLVPTGEGGLLGSSDLLQLRKGLRDGSLVADEAVDATRLISLDNAYRAAVQQARRVTGGKLNALELPKKYDSKTLNEIADYLQGAKNPATLSGKQLDAYNVLKKQFDDFYDEAVQASKATGYVPPKRANYFPQMRSDKALRWVERNPKIADSLAQKLKVDRTWFVGNFQPRDLKKGDSWFGHVLDTPDLNINKLNELARKPAAGSGFSGLDFDFFETDVLKVINKYANSHAQLLALQKTLGDLPSQYPDLFRATTLVEVPRAGRRFDDPAGLRVADAPPVKVMGPVYKAEGAFAGDVVAKIFPFEIYDPVTGVGIDASVALERLTTGELTSLIDDTKKIVTDARKPLVLKNDINKGLDQLNARLNKIGEDYFAGRLSAPAAGVLADEITKKVASFKTELGRAAGAILATPNNVFNNVPVNRWVEYVDVVGDGFKILNETTAPNIAARADIAELFKNASRMDDKKFAGVVKQALRDYTTFSKSYLTARPGFHIRNGLSNIFTVVAAGANIEAIRSGGSLANKINAGLKAGRTPERIAEDLVKNYLVPKNIIKLGKQGNETYEGVVRALTDAINYSGATGFGQFGEIAEAVGQGSRGFLQMGDPRNALSKGIGKVLYGSRKIGTRIEDVSRFTLTWDGLLKGLTPQEAVARTNKYLLDYSDYSKLDQVGRTIFPFWTFMTRNAPMQLELMWTNPKAYAQFNSLRRNLEDTRTEEEGKVTVPGYSKDRGIFASKEEGFGKLFPGNAINPGLPFPGGGEESLTRFVTDPMKQLSGVNAVFRAPVEAFLRGETGKKFFTGGAVVPKEFADKPFEFKLLYLGQELLAPKSPLASIVAFTPLRRNELLQTILGLKSDPEDPLTQELASALQWGGLPFTTVRTEQEIREYQSRLYDLADAITKAGKVKTREEEQIVQDRENLPISEDETTNITGDPDDPWGLLTP